MAGFRTPTPLVIGPTVDSASCHDCVAGFAPGTLTTLPRPEALPARVTPRFTTDLGLLSLARTVELKTERDRTVLYAEDEGKVRAAAFIAVHGGYTRLDELLARSKEGQQLWAALTIGTRPWSDTEEVWWELSRRLARAASGIVNVFGPPRLIRDAPIEAFRHKYQRNAYANTVFEKVEWPELEQNDAVTRVFYNERPYSG